MRGAVLFMVCLLAGSAFAETTVDDLFERLEGPNPILKARAIDELARRKVAKALVPMLLALRSEAAEVRAHAADGLKVLGDPVAVPFLALSLEDPDDTVRCRAVLALGELADRYIVPTLHHALEDPSVIVRAAAIRALGEIGDPLSLPDILAAQKREPVDLNGSVTAAALIAAAKIAGKEGLDRSYRLAEEKLPKTWFLRAAAARAIGIAGDRERIPLLKSFLARDPDSRTAQAAAAALGAMGARKELVSALSLPAPARRKAAVTGLAALEGPEVREALIGATEDEDPAVALAAADTLAGRGVSEALPVLIRLLEVDRVAWMGALASLKRRTGENFGRNPPRWWRWFERHRLNLVFDRRAGRFRPGR